MEDGSAQTMIQKIKAFFSATVFEGDLEKTLKSRQLTNILNVLLAGTIIYIIILPLFAGGLPPRWYLILPLDVVCIGGQMLVRRGRLPEAGQLLVIGLWLTITSAEVTQGGVKAPAFVGNIIVILTAAILDGLSSAMVFTVLTFIKGLVLILTDKNGFLPAPMDYATSDNVILLTQIFASALVITLLQISTQNIRLALGRAHRELAERRQVEKELLQSEQNYRGLYETAQKLAQELSLEGEVRTAMAQELDLPALLRSVVESIAKSYGYTFVSLYLIEGDALILQHQVGYENVISKIALTEGISGRVARTGNAVLLEDVRSDPEFLGAIENLVSEICVPLFDEGRIVGTLNVESTNDIKLMDADLKLLTGLSEYIGIAIGQARLYSNVQQRNRILSALEQSTLVLMRQLGLEDVLQTIVSQAAQIMDTSHGYIYLVQADEKTIRATTGVGIFSESVGKKLKPDEGLAGKVWTSGQPLNVPNYHAWPGRSHQFDDVTFHAVVGVPLTSRLHVIGVLGLAHLEPGRVFSGADIELLSQFAQLASVALENARLYSLVQQELIERKQTEESLQMFQYSIDQAMDAIFWMDRFGGFSYVNEKACLSLGYTREELLNLRLWEIDPVYPRELWDVNWEKYQKDRQGGDEHVETLHRRKDGSVFPVEVFSKHLWFGNRELHIAVVRDITERKHTEAEREKLITDLENKNAELERFTYTVSHDLKSPLVTIRGFLGFVEQDTQSGDTERLQADIQRISDATDRMHRLLRELTQLARVGQLMNAPVLIPFADLVREVLEVVHGQLEAGGIKVRVQPNLPDVYGDRPRLVEVLQNLIDNAAKYMGDQPNPRIEIGWQEDENSDPIFYIRDNGIGIAPEYHEMIFGLFNKLDATSDGTGIGLAIVKRIIEVHGGRIWVESEVGRETTFYFTLPVEGHDD